MSVEVSFMIALEGKLGIGLALGSADCGYGMGVIN